MLSGTLEEMTQLKFPVASTPKLDGIRCLRIDNNTVSRKFLPIPNLYIQEKCSNLINEIDGELMTKNPDGSYKDFNKIQGDVMRESGTPDFHYCVFDYVKTSLKTDYLKRMEHLESLTLPKFCRKILPTTLYSLDELAEYEAKCLKENFEGVMLRSLDSPYKCGRSSLKQGWLLKLKRFKDSEAKIIGFEEMLHNENEAEKDELGHTKRSSAKEGMVLANTLGKFIVEEIGDTPWKGKQFGIGTGRGLDASLRKEIWNNQSKYVDKIITYSFQAVGLVLLPRLPIFRGFRSRIDL